MSENTQTYSTKEGESAFPFQVGKHAVGLTKLEHGAMQIMAAIMSHPTVASSPAYAAVQAVEAAAAVLIAIEIHEQRTKIVTN